MMIHPSLASANQLELGTALRRLATLAPASVHLDIEDTSFIRNITFGLKTVAQVAAATRIPLSIHLMVANPFPWVEWLKPLNPAWIFVQAEALANPAEILTLIRATGAKAGLAFNPVTLLSCYGYLASFADSIMVMTSEPDGYGQAFNPRLVEKVQQAASLFRQSEIWADGGIDLPSAKLLYQAGAQHLVLGRAIFGSDNGFNNYAANAAKFRGLEHE
ncbi:epimerase [Budvicia diplopodorum]|uniref:epimerase n=1 Tax=Budvicia diplopodorum TaxID=1119056 RepID=UPI00135BE61C|nr:epimerase [Budvicia diplopodorum]